MSTPQNGANDAKTVALTKIVNLQNSMQEGYVQSQLKAALGDNAPAFAASLIDLFTTDKNLQECDPRQVIMQAMKAAILKLPVHKSLGFSYIIAYKGVPEFQLGYKGLMQLALRTGKYRIINADVVYDGEYKTSNKLTGEFDLNGMAKSENVIGYFAHFEMLNGFSKTFFMSKERVTKHGQKFSKSFANNYSPWQTNFDAMGIKTVLKYLLSHYGELSIEAADVLDKEDIADTVENEISAKGNRTAMSMDKVEEAQFDDTNNQAQNPVQTMGGW